MSDSIAAARELLSRRYGRRSEAAFLADPHVQTGTDGEDIVYFQQVYNGIPFFGGHTAVHLGDGHLAGEYSDARDLDCVPEISAVDAVLAAFAHFASRSYRTGCQMPHGSRRRPVSDPAVIASFPLASRPTILGLPRSRAFIYAHLEFFEGELTWVVRLPLRGETFVLLVAANGQRGGDVVFCTAWSAGARCTGRVFGFNDVRASFDFPVATTLFPSSLLGLPSSQFLADWIDDQSTIGNNVETFFGNKQTLVTATNRVFASNLNTRDQALLNAFFFCNYLHDFFLLLGFGEQEGNFQQKNPQKSPGAKDRLVVKVFTNTFPHLGKMDAQVDGQPAELKLGIAPNGEQVAHHCDVVIHEYTHGVTQRMVGGRRGAATLVRKQSLALSEAWSDYFAITLRNHHLPAASRNFTFAGWAGLPRPARSAPYDRNYPGHYGLLGRPPHDHPHGAGEIFAAALIRFNEFIAAELGNDQLRGDSIGWRVVLESLRHCNPANPTILDAREAVFRAITKVPLSTAETAAAQRAAADAFAKYGMGPDASGPPSSEFGPTIPDTTP